MYKVIKRPKCGNNYRKTLTKVEENVLCPFCQTWCTITKENAVG